MNDDNEKRLINDIKEYVNTLAILSYYEGIDKESVYENIMDFLERQKNLASKD